MHFCRMLLVWHKLSWQNGMRIPAGFALNPLHFHGKGHSEFFYGSMISTVLDEITDSTTGTSHMGKIQSF